jgi:hypothetical protein
VEHVQQRSLSKFSAKSMTLALRHSRELTRVCARKLTQLPAFGGDDNAFPTCGLRVKARRFLWVTLSEHKWVILGERRGAGGCAPAKGCPGGVKVFYKLPSISSHRPPPEMRQAMLERLLPYLPFVPQEARLLLRLGC